MVEHPCWRLIALDTDHAPFLSATNGLVEVLIELAADAQSEPAEAPSPVPTDAGA
jgi:hypothetical protein